MMASALPGRSDRSEQLNGRPLRSALLAVIVLGLLLSGVVAGGCTTTTHVLEGSSALWPAPILGVVVDRTMQIVHIVPGSAAEQDGLLVGDVLASVAGTPVSTPAQARDLALREIQEQSRPPTPGQTPRVDRRPILLGVRRNGQVVVLAVTPRPPGAPPASTVRSLATPTPVPFEMTYF